MENKIKQLRKGILELAILGSLNHKSHYGYSLIKDISGESDINLTEGTIYPILNRLSKEELIESEWMESKQGPPRKYYSLTPKGEKVYSVLNTEFKKLAVMVANAGKKTKKPDLDGKRKKLSVKTVKTIKTAKKEMDDAK